MKIFMACPAPPRSRKGNRVTAVRWARFLKELGHHVSIGESYDGTRCDVLVALHARRSYQAAARYRRLFPDGPLVVALTGTDLYRDIRRSKSARRSLELADRLILLQPRGIDELPLHVRPKARVIYQSAKPTAVHAGENHRLFEVCVLGHLRYEKDPFRAALALQQVPASTTIRVTHAGQALSPAMAARAGALMARDSRYRWIGEVPRWRARQLLARSRLLVLSSRMEGGANVISEALADGVPVLASRIPGSVGLLGQQYPGFFPVGGTTALAQLLKRAESEPNFYSRLTAHCRRLAPLVQPARERASWKKLLTELDGRKTAKERQKK
ncbi:MAG TPA: selenoneine biosynthesis selenosugar synthase SenB [Gemmataceae bacterium]|nr:selenoneine biosynthesis selenosugar synthase SenB [Gemmataceae bacterium]